MRALTVVLLVAVAAMLVVGCGPKKEELPPLEPADGQPARLASRSARRTGQLAMRAGAKASLGRVPE